MKTSNQSGFTMIEVLISMIILAIGLLGLAGLQSNSLRFNNSAYLRSQASYLAIDIADKMRANQDAIIAGSFDNIDADGDNYDIGTCYDAGAVCTTDQMATSAIAQWEDLLVQLLPSGNATVTQGVNSTFRVVITWVDNTADPDDNTKTFTTSFRP